LIKYPILYSFRRCPYAIRARLALAKLEITVEHREVFLKKRPQALYDISSKGTVPVLQLLDGRVIDESLDIMKWAMHQGEQDWFSEEVVEQERLILHNDSSFKCWLDKYKYNNHHPENSREYYRNKCNEILLKYDKILKNQSYLMGEKPSLADAAIFPFIRQCANVDYNWFAENLPQLEKWLEGWIQSEIFSSVMEKFEQWRIGDPPQYISFQAERI